MANSFGSGLGFEIHTDSCTNAVKHVAVKKSKIPEVPGRPVMQKRAALGTITNQQRAQAVKPAKPVVVKPAKPCPEKAPQFIIYRDDDKENKPGLSPSTASLKRNAKSKRDKKSVESGRSRSGYRHSDSPMLYDAHLSSPLAVLTNSSDVETVEYFAAPEYAEEIYDYLRGAELKYQPKIGYLKKQPDITDNMRTILVDWLVEVGVEYKLQRETLFLAVNFVDRFLSQMSVLRGRLQLLGTASMWLAAKYEEVYPPDVRDFVYITDDTYTKEQVIKMEALLLKVLGFDLAAPTANVFAHRFLEEVKAKPGEKLHFLVLYLIELSMMDAEAFMTFVPSRIAASAVCLASYTLGLEPWPQNMATASRYDLPSLEGCVRTLRTAFANAPTSAQTAVREKFKHTDLKCVASICPPETLPFPPALTSTLDLSSCS